MTRRRYLSAIALLALLGGCAQQSMEFDRPNLSDSDFARDRYECSTAALNAGDVYANASSYGYSAWGSSTRIPNWEVGQMCMEARGYRRTR